MMSARVKVAGNAQSAMAIGDKLTGRQILGVAVGVLGVTKHRVGCRRAVLVSHRDIQRTKAVDAQFAQGPTWSYPLGTVGQQGE